MHLNEQRYCCAYDQASAAEQAAGRVIYKGKVLTHRWARRSNPLSHARHPKELTRAQRKGRFVLLPHLADKHTVQEVLDLLPRDAPCPYTILVPRKRQDHSQFTKDLTRMVTLVYSVQHSCAAWQLLWYSWLWPSQGNYDYIVLTYVHRDPRYDFIAEMTRTRNIARAF